MRNFIVTIDGKQYSVGVEEVGESGAEVKSIAPVVSEAPKAAPAVAAPANGEKVLSPFPD